MSEPSSRESARHALLSGASRRPSPRSPRVPPSPRTEISLGLVLLLVAACRDEPEPAPLAPAWASPADPAPSAACGDCHPDETESFARSPMARALGAVHAEELAGLNDLVDEATGLHYRFAMRDGAPRIQEVHPERPDFAFEAELRFAIGAGVFDRSYAALVGEGLYFAPLEVLTRPEGREAVLAPPHAIAPGLRFESPITNECLGCHTDATPPADFPLNLDPTANGWEPHGLTCAACHGAVEAHREWREGELDGARPEGADPVLRPGTLTRIERLSVCAACHLQGDARIVLDADALGPPPPGGDLLERRALFVAAEPTAEIGFVSQTERLALSRCFVESEMVCETCHDPHRSLDEEGERARVRSACLACHPGEPIASQRNVSRGTRPEAVHASACGLADEGLRAALDAGRDCAGCHLPLTPVFDVEELSVHDHFVRARPAAVAPPERIRFAESPTAQWRRFTWPGVDPPAHVDEAGLWLMALVSRGHRERAREHVDRPAGAVADGLPMYHHVRATLLEELGREAEAIAAYERALALDPELAISATNLAPLLARAGRPDEALARLEAVLERFPKAEGALRNRALLHRERGRDDLFVRDLHAAFVVRPTLVLATALEAACRARGDEAGVRTWGAMRRLLDPGPLGPSAAGGGRP